MLSDRLVAQNGILIMGSAALAMMLLTHGSVQFLVVLYSINVFITFVLSQLGMVCHWWKSRSKVKHWQKKLLINGVGLIMTAFILISVIVLKFHEGGWITILITGSLIGIVVAIKRHYHHTARLLNRLNDLISAAEASISDFTNGTTQNQKSGREFDPNAKTAVLLVNGYNGLGVHTLLGVIRMFGGIFKNFIFVQVGVVDAGNFKGSEEVEHLQKHVQRELDRYEKFIQPHGYYAESFYSIGIDVIEEVDKIASKVLERFPDAVFFGGQLVFPKESIFSRWLHNYTIFAMQRRFYYQGITVIILPIRV
jgi:hypothetical protein